MAPHATPGERLKRWRKAKGLNLTASARCLEISVGHLCNLENGKRMAGRDVAVRIKRLVGIPVEKWESPR